MTGLFSAAESLLLVRRFVGDLVLINLLSGIPLERKEVIWESGATGVTECSLFSRRIPACQQLEQQLRPQRPHWVPNAVNALN